MRDGDGGFGLGDGRCVCGGAGLELGKGRRCGGRGWRRQLGRAEGLQVRGGGARWEPQVCHGEGAAR